MRTRRQRKRDSQRSIATWLALVVSLMSAAVVIDIAAYAYEASGEVDIHLVAYVLFVATLGFAVSGITYIFYAGGFNDS